MSAFSHAWWREQAKLDQKRPRDEYTIDKKPDDRDDTIWRLHKEGRSNGAIGRIVGLSKPCVGHHIRKMVREGRS